MLLPVTLLLVKGHYALVGCIRGENSPVGFDPQCTVCLVIDLIPKRARYELRCRYSSLGVALGLSTTPSYTSHVVCPFRGEAEAVAQKTESVATVSKLVRTLNRKGITPHRFVSGSVRRQRAGGVVVPLLNVEAFCSAEFVSSFEGYTTRTAYAHKVP